MKDPEDPVAVAKGFSLVFQTANEQKMNELLTEDFRYYTNIPCSYKGCEAGAAKTDYINGVIEERRDRNFKVMMVFMKPIAPVINTAEERGVDAKASFVCALITRANSKPYQFQSVIDYFLRKQDGQWKIFRIENRIIE